MIGSYLISNFSDRHEFVTLGRRPTLASGVSVRHIFHDFIAAGTHLNLPIRDRFDAVIHLAQARRFRDFPNAITETFLINSLSTLSLLEYGRATCAKIFVLASTGGLYQPSRTFLRETSRLKHPNNLNPYFASKLAAEATCGAYSSLFRIIIPRLFFPFGHRQNPEQLFPRLVSSVKEGRPITLGGDAGLQFNPIPASHAADAIEAMLHTDISGPVNVAGSEVVDLRAFVGHISSALGKKAVFQRVGEADRLVADVALLGTFWNRSAYSLEDSVREATLLTTSA